MTPERWQEIERLYQDAIELDPEERTGFLAKACADEDIRREVESLLVHGNGGSSFITSRDLDPGHVMATQNQNKLRDGQMVGRYQVLAFVGAGGMGDVYRARDTKLGRDVALKVLPDEFARDPDRLLRSEREAKLLASLNHPNIGAIYDLDDSNEIHCLVLEFVEGQTLADRLKRGALPLKETVAICTQIADALQAAHAQGVVHRDLKPGNVMITHGGKVKVLDFGIAKILEPKTAPGSPIHAATLSAGMVMGTPAYMSPEQARGNPVDKQTDIWAFGCVLYELLGRKPAFAGKTASDTIVRVLEHEPGWDALPNDVPATIRRLLERCLRKDTRQRLHDIADARIELESLSTQPVWEATAHNRSFVKPAGIAVAVTLAVASLIGALLWRSRSTPSSTEWPAGQIHFSISEPPGSTFTDLPGLKLSADGQNLAWLGSGSDGKTRIWVRQFASDSAREISGTEGAANPFWSPDGRHLGFQAAGNVKLVELSTGSFQTIARVPSPSNGGSWSPLNIVVFSARLTLQQIPSAGGQATTAAELDRTRQEDSLRHPQFLPDGRHFLYVARSGRPGNSRAYVGSLDGRRVPLFATLTQVEYAPPGYLLYVREGTLVAQPFDATSFKIGSDVFPIVEGMGANTPVLHADFSVSQNGVLAYRKFTPPLEALCWFDRSGKLLEKIEPPGVYSTFRIAPDGRRVAADLSDFRAGTISSWVQESGSSVPSRLTLAGSFDWQAVWSPDGSRIVFGSFRDGVQNLYMKPTSGSEPDKLVLPSDEQKSARDWSADGRYIAYQNISETTRLDVWVLPLEGDNPQPIPVARTNFQEYEPRFSPDGRWLAYVSDEAGQDEVFLQPFPPTGAKAQISTGGGVGPAWRKDGKELFYINGKGDLVAVEVKSTLPFFGAPVRLFKVPGRAGGVANTRFDTRDGQRFLVRVPVDDAPPRQPITVVLNWTQTLKK